MAKITQQLLAAVLLQVLNGVSAAPLNPRQDADFTANPNIGPGGSTFQDSAHFRIYDGATADVTEALAALEAAYECFIGNLGWRSSGLSYKATNDDGPFTKTNVYSVASLPGAAGVMNSDADTGMGWIKVQNEYLAMPGVTVHEFGHVMHYHQQTWVDQVNTGAWWETLANWVAETFQTSDLCAAARANHSQPTATTSKFEPIKVIGDSFQVLVDGTPVSGNYYQAWPFFTYLTNNPDGLAGLGKDTMHQLMAQYIKNSNESPLQTLSRVSTNATVAQIVGRYWARMAYVDIGHPLAQGVFESQKSSINFANVDASGSDGSYKVKTARQPRYMGANIIPLTTAAAGAEVAVKVTAASEFTATLAVHDTSANTVRYVELVGGAGSTTVASGETASLVVANTPATLLAYDGFKLGSSPANVGMDYSFTLTGATA